MKLQLWITGKNHYCELRQSVARWEEHVTTQPQHDQWAGWLFQRRHGGDPELLRHLEPDLPEFEPA
jgi:hypothetical protein